MTVPVEQRAFTDAERFAWLRLWRSENVGPRTFATLLARYGSAEAALDALPGLICKTGRSRPIRIADRDEIEREREAADACGAVWLCHDEKGYPKLLREIANAPAVIAVRGRPDILDKPAVAIVGSRNASAAGLAFAERLARHLGQAGYVIVSGFARGIDSRAHRASLPSGTVAVLAGGHDRLYPADQEPLLNMMLEDGAAISEMPFGWEARGRDFPRRNRLISGLSLGLIVVEAARRSGSLITARFAADQGRDVFAVPGSPLDPRAEGTNDLIRDGAVFCTSADDVIETLKEGRGSTQGPVDTLFDAAGPDPDRFWDELDLDADGGSDGGRSSAGTAFFAEDKALEAPFGPSDDRSTLERVVERLGPAPVSLDELARSTDLRIGDVRGALLQLEIEGRLERHGGGLVSLLMG